MLGGKIPAMRQNRGPIYRPIYHGIPWGQKYIKFCHADSVRFRVEYFIELPRNTTFSMVIFVENSTWNLMESLWKMSHVLPPWNYTRYKTGTFILQDRQIPSKDA